MNRYLIYILLMLAAGAAHAQKKFDKQAHRGGRGLMPENTIPAMKNALDMGNTLELDLYFSKDRQIVVSHDSYISHIFALNPDGSQVTKEQATKYKLLYLNYDEIVKFDVGSRFHPEFPDQKKMVAYIPLLSELIDSVEAYAKLKHLPSPKYNIEAKVSGGVTLWPTFREDFIKAVVDIVLEKRIKNRIMIQSFDVRMLEILNSNYPKITTSYLVGKDDLEVNMKKLSFAPDIYSPYYILVDKKLVEDCHKRKMKVLPWTVNTKEEIEKLKSLGVDGIITDYPNLF